MKRLQGQAEPSAQKLFRLGISIILLVLIGVLFVQSIEKSPGSTVGNTESQKINLALRRTAHQLLRAVGDSTSRIPPVRLANPLTYRLELGHSFDYDQLPSLLKESFTIHHITEPYDVAVLDCEKGDLQLGYTSTLLGKESVSCGGRSMTAGCYVLQVTFINPPATPVVPAPSWPMLALGGLLVGLLVVVWYPAKPQKITETASSHNPSPTPELTNRLHFGQSWLDVTNQNLMSGGQLQNLTYREAKLLKVLVNHTNQVLERDRILQLVWEDEGVTVGRSLDVFVSRLRKLLSNDSSVRIAAVHGVGYRLEVA